MKRKTPGVPREGGERAPRLPPPVPETPDARGFYVQKKDITEHGYIPGCRGCEAVRKGAKRAVAHNSECRKRIFDEVGKQAAEKHRVARFEDRMAGRLERRIEFEEEQEKKKPKVEMLPLEDKKDEVVPAGREKRVEPESPSASVGSPSGSPSKRWKADGHMKYKRVAETPLEELDERAASGSAEAEVVPAQASAAVPDVPPVISSNAVSVADVVVAEKKGATDGGGDVSSIDWGAYETVDTSTVKWREISSLDYAARRLESRRLELGSVDVAEVFSPPRFVARAGILGLSPGFSVDLSTKKPILGKENEYWDLNRAEDRKDLNYLIEKEQPFLLTGSPRCDPFSVLQNISKHRERGPDHELRRRQGEEHLDYSVELYKKQMDDGRYFLHEHPAGADSWDRDSVVGLQNLDGVYTVSGPMCCWNMAIGSSKKGRGKVYKMTRWITNSREIAKVLDKYCTNRRGGPIHRHVPLVGGIARLCEAYPLELVDAVLEGLKKQMLSDRAISSIELHASGPVPTEPLFDEKTMSEMAGEVMDYYDDISGEKLPYDLVVKARQEEINWVRSIGFYDKVPRAVALQRGVRPLQVRWVDVNKGDRSHYKVRSRIVGKELKSKTREALLAHELFSATPPWETVKGLFSLLVTDLPAAMTGGEPLVMCVYDISRAHFMPAVEREIYIELPDEDKLDGDGDVVGRLKRNMYGCRDASHGWMKDWQALLASGGYQVGEANPALFFNEDKFSRGAVHGDDFYVLGPKFAIDDMKELLGSKYQMREAHRLGFSEGCVRSATVLNRVVELGESDGRKWVRIEPDKRHVELIWRAVGMNSKSNGVTTPSIKPTDEQAHQLQFSPELPAAQASQYRSAVMRASFLSQERSDLSETVKRLAQGMSKVRLAHWEMLKRMARYLSGGGVPSAEDARPHLHMR